MLGKPLMYSFVSLALFIIFQLWESCNADSGHDFVYASGTHFNKTGEPLYLNGFNAYWMMIEASEPSSRAMVTTTIQQASKCGMNIARIWAFSDGGQKPLQYSPGSYNEDMFRGLDFVISEAKKYGIHLILSLVNNYEDYGGRKQYVQWARDQGGQSLSNDDEFYTNSVVKGYYKNHVKTVLTRINSMTNIAYKDDLTIFAWELINEPRCLTDLSGRHVQDWVQEMAAHVKSIDNNHLLEIGLEGFYGESMPERKQYNPRGEGVGTDFISNNQVPGVDFATIHLYPEQWLPSSTEEEQAAFADKWIQAHIQDSNSVLKKPLLLGEFGRSSRLPGYSVLKRDTYFGKLYNDIYTSASSGGPFVGGLFWQIMAHGMDSYRDGYEVVLEESPSTASVIDQQSRKLGSLK